MSDYGSHYSVMFHECMEGAKLGITDDHPVFADMTFGAGGHTFGLTELHGEAITYSTDQDPDALKNGYARIASSLLKDRIHLLNMNFENFPDWVSENHPDLKFTSILMDLGVSSHQFDTKDRGFSFREDAPLDMRMNYADDSIATASDLVNGLDEESLANLIYKYGEERLSRRIAKEICLKRAEKRIETTKELEDICFHCYPKSNRFKGIHPATRTFQALRIAVNKELEVLENTISKLFSLLAPQGVLMIISFHSLEDRIAKHRFKEIFESDKNGAKILTKKPMLPTDEEIAENKRSRSAKLRMIQRL